MKINSLIQFEIPEDNSSDFLYLTPGINIISSKNNDQNYKTPKDSFNTGSDIIIVGSAIYLHNNPLSIIHEYK